MNNEPVAWMHKPSGTVFNEIIACVEPDDLIPLYTHPAKESKAKDRFSNYESICLQCGTTIYKPAFKTLTDEEIKELSEKHLDMDWQTGVIEFARAILRKAQEK